LFESFGDELILELQLGVVAFHGEHRLALCLAFWVIVQAVGALVTGIHGRKFSGNRSSYLMIFSAVLSWSFGDILLLGNFIFLDQHMQFSPLILVIQNLTPSELLIFHNMINGICLFKTMNPWY